MTRPAYLDEYLADLWSELKTANERQAAALLTRAGERLTQYLDALAREEREAKGETPQPGASYPPPRLIPPSNTAPVPLPIESEEGYQAGYWRLVALQAMGANERRGDELEKLAGEMARWEERREQRVAQGGG